MEAGWALFESSLENDPGNFLQESTHDSNIFRYSLMQFRPEAKQWTQIPRKLPLEVQVCSPPGPGRLPQFPKGIKRHKRSYLFFFSVN